MADSILFAKSKRFASLVVKAVGWLHENKKEFVLSKQFLRSGTSIGANLAEAQYAASENDFVNKLRIALKECAETLYWIDLLSDNRFLVPADVDALRTPCEELRRMLVSSICTVCDRKRSETTVPAEPSIPFHA